jgi:hypothetical protein
MCGCGCGGPCNGSPRNPTGGAKMDWTDFLSGLTTAGASLASTVVQATATPSVIPGTSAIYNPSTGQIINTSSLAGGSSMILIVVLVLAAIFLLRK